MEAIKSVGGFLKVLSRWKARGTESNPKLEGFAGLVGNEMWVWAKLGATGEESAGWSKFALRRIW